MSEKLYLEARNKRDKIFHPIVKFLLKHKVKANWLSYIGVVLALATYYAVDKSLLLAIVLMLTAKFFDMLDGPLARASHKLDPHGATIDIMCDQVVFFFAMLAIIKINLVNFLLGGTLLFLIYLSKILRSIYYKSFRQLEHKYKYLLLPIVVTAIPYFTAVIYFFSGIKNYDVLLGALAIILIVDCLVYLFKIVFREV